MFERRESCDFRPEPEEPRVRQQNDSLSDGDSTPLPDNINKADVVSGIVGFWLKHAGRDSVRISPVRLRLRFWSR